MRGTHFAALATIVFSAGCTDAIGTVAPATANSSEARRPATGPHITDLGTLAGRESYAYGVNTSADGLRLLIAGEFTDAARRTRAATWSYTVSSGGLTATPLAAPSGDVQSSAWSIDASGVAVGYSVGPVTNGGITRSVERAVRWTSPSEAFFLGDLGGFGSQANDINGQGQIVGSALTSDGAQHAVLWDATTGIAADLRFFGNDLQAVDINETTAGAIVGGIRKTATTLQTAFVWTSSGGLVLLPDFGPPPLNNGIVSFAMGVNDAGVIVGFVNAAAFGGVRAVRWDPTTSSPSGYVVRDLGRGTNSRANGINNREEIVGSHGGTAFYLFGSVAKDLPALSHSAVAWKISESGAIVGYSSFRNSYNHAVLWTNVRDP